MVSCNEAVTSFSGQFMIGLISFMCRPMVMTKSVAMEDLMYGVKSSSKFIEKMIGMLEYLGDTLRQYKSFKYFIKIKSDTINEKKSNKDTINSLQIIANKDSSKSITLSPKRQVMPGNLISSVTLSPKRQVMPGNLISSITHEFILDNGHLIRIVGANGVGKTTLFLKFLGVNYQGATSRGIMNAFNPENKNLLPLAYRKSIAFVQQNIPLSYDSVGEYICAVSRSTKNPRKILKKTLNHFEIENNTKNSILEFIDLIGMDKSIRELSGGQSKFIQILAAVIKLYVQNGRILILDEPSNNLDTDKIDKIIKLFTACISNNITIIMITHDNRMISGFDYYEIEI